MGKEEKQKYIMWQSFNMILYEKMGNLTQIYTSKFEVYFSYNNFALKEITTELSPVNKHNSCLLLNLD